MPILGQITDHSDPPNLRIALAAQRGLIGLVVIFGIFVNILFLTGPIFALQVYDRVLSSRSVETLVALTILMAFLFLILGLVDHARRRIAARIGERMADQLEEPAFDAVTHQNIQHTSALDDLEILRRFFGSALFVALFDLPWLPVFLIAIALFHPLLGWLALFGAVVIATLGLASTNFASASTATSENNGLAARGWAQMAASDRAAGFGLDIRGTVFTRWRSLGRSTRLAGLLRQDQTAAFGAATQTFRLFLQSAIIALGAYLVLQGSLTAGAIIATSVLLWRALAPLDMVSQSTGTLGQIFTIWRRLTRQLAPQLQSPAIVSQLLADRGLQVEQLTVFPPGTRQAALRLVTFELGAGQAIGVTGASGSGKTALANALIGHWPIAGGMVRFGGVPVARIAAAEFYRQVGYLPQELRFHPGTIEENICNFEICAATTTQSATTLAATRAGAHDLITVLADGYQTRLAAAPNTLPGGLLQKIGLARAIYGAPALLILDEPGNNLDADGMGFLNQIVQSTCAAGGSAVVFSQRRATLAACDRMLLLQGGKQIFLGPPGPVSVPQTPATGALSSALDNGAAT